MITVSIVSHGHGVMVNKLVSQLLACSDITRIIVTLNLPESLALPVDVRVQVIENSLPQGFGANHNAAFTKCETPYFCVLNPDIELIGNPFSVLAEQLTAGRAGLSAPLVLGSNHQVEDSVREFMTPYRILLRKLGVGSAKSSPVIGEAPIYPDWVAGMFMLFNAADFRRVNGFDTAYFMYCEDADICTRLWQAGIPVMVCPDVQVIHHAQRASRTNLRYLKWHVMSMLRYFARYWGRLPQTTRPL